MQQLETIKGEVTRVRRFENGYTILTLKNKKTTTTLVGDMPAFAEGTNIVATAQKTIHPKYGDQYKVVEIQETGFSSREGLVNYLSSDRFHGVGKAYAGKIVKHLGLEALQRLDEDPDRIYEVLDLPEAVAQSFRECWDGAREEHRVLGALMKMGLTGTVANKARALFGAEAPKIIQDNPYELVRVEGVGFLKADAIALGMGVKRDSPSRVEAATLYAMEQALLSGDCFLPLPDLGDKVTELLGDSIDRMFVLEAIRALVAKGLLVNQQHRVYLSHIHTAEKEAAKRLKEMLDEPCLALCPSLESLRDQMAALGITEEITLAPRQEEALLNALNSRVAVITGAPGTGKSSITRALCQLLDHHRLDFKLCSPTGRAAKRLAEATGREAQTIHRMLEFSSKAGGFLYDQSNPLPARVVIIDEASMVDIRLFRDVLNALDRQKRLIIIGDKDQLPSVGPGNVLRDLISSGAVPCVKLDQIFRQAKGNTIITVAHDILHGNVPDLPTPAESKGRNAMLVIAEEQETLIAHILTLITKSLPQIGYKPEDIQVLTPMRAKGLGVQDLNPRLQAVLNPPDPLKAEISLGFRILRVGDRVMQIKNNYNKGPNGVFNGDLGYIAAIIRSGEKATVWVRYPDMDDVVEYEQEELEEIVHAFACTVHKSQGAEYPVVILVQHTSQYNMLQRNLIYTGVTRAKKICILAGTRRAVEVAVTNDKMVQRNTTLAELISNTG